MDLKIFEDYKKELTEDCKLDELNLKDVQLKLPGNKGKWVTRLIQQKNILNQLKRNKTSKVNQLAKQISEETTVELSKQAITRKVSELDTVKDIDKQIEETEMIILYLEKIDVIMRGLNFDISNVIKIRQLECS